MFLAPDTRSTARLLTRHDSVFVLVLTLALLLATSTFFASFAVAALLVGLVLSVVLHHYDALDDHAGPPHAGRQAGINIASVRVGGDAGGLIFVVGSVFIVVLGVPSLRWFLIASAGAAGLLAWVLVAWKSRM